MNHHWTTHGKIKGTLRWWRTNNTDDLWIMKGTVTLSQSLDGDYYLGYEGRWDNRCSFRSGEAMGMIPLPCTSEWTIEDAKFATGNVRARAMVITFGGEITALKKIQLTIPIADASDGAFEKHFVKAFKKACKDGATK